MRILFLMICLWGLPATAQEVSRSFGPALATTRLLVRSTTDINVFGPVIDAFLATRPGLAIDYEQWGSNALFDLSLADCAVGRPGADVVISSGVHQMVQMVNNACAAPHVSALTTALPPALRWRDELWGITREAAVMAYNRDLVPLDDVPLTRFDLLDLLRPTASPYAGKVATYDVESSGLGYLFAFSDAREATTFGALLESLGRTGAVATCCSAEIIAGVADGTYLIAYNVLGSYAQVAAQSDPRIGIVLPQDYTLVLSRALMIPKAATHSAEAAAFLDFLLSVQGRAVLADVLLIDPLTDDASAEERPPVSETTLRPIGLSPALIVAMDQQKRAQFIRRWRENFSNQDLR
ncbi:ABC transporter substrate-binding protein [Puniceibacterium sediminis]|uniref:Iron(III) transport system substrate-binding protein n=1 Tax=Puniceibacterium sediminis TaxID=1608407 RepID=A0A238UTH2_9RHOB|nr:ABC transporter substrate-binding protein [Puniceibacterium sediminis]SNR24599.1 iron(III) transport system substrate-binding protein [Puniceibacterium sediminis]